MEEECRKEIRQSATGRSGSSRLLCLLFRYEVVDESPRAIGISVAIAQLMNLSASHIDPLDFEIRRQLIMVFRHLSASKNVHLRLYGYRRSLWKAIYVDALGGGGEIRVGSMSKAASLLIRIEALTSQTCQNELAKLFMIPTNLDVRRYCCCGESICGCSLKTSSLCLCKASEMRSKSASVKLFRSIPYTSAPKSTPLDGPCCIETTLPLLVSLCGSGSRWVFNVMAARDGLLEVIVVVADMTMIASVILRGCCRRLLNCLARTLNPFWHC